MQGKTNFLKRPALRSKSHHQLNISTLPTRTLTTKHTEESSIRIKKESIKDFTVIGIFDRKVIVSFNNKLKLFGNFDLHAVHERIRYEFYCWKIRSENWVTAQISHIEPMVVEKGKKEPHLAFGPLKKCLIKIENPIQLLQLNFKASKLTIWGVTFQKNSSNQVFVTSFHPIFGKQFSSLQIINIAKQLPRLSREGLPRVINDWIGEFSCKSAFKFNDTLSIDDAKRLIQNLGHCEFPWHCVHGRTTIHIKPWPGGKF